MDYWGYIMQDDHVAKAVRQQKALVERYPHAPASRCFLDLARRVSDNRPHTAFKGNIGFFWQQLVDGSDALPLEMSKV
jgi:flagellar biosynthesis protein FlhG